MAKAPLRPCSYPGCRELVVSGRCAAHRVTADQSWQRDPERQALYDRRWRKIRAGHLAISPWCVVCLAAGIYTPATDVDHIVDHKGNREMFYTNKLQSLCKKHHSEKTIRENAPGGAKKFSPGGCTARGVSDAKKSPNVGNSGFNSKSESTAQGQEPKNGDRPEEKANRLVDQPNGHVQKQGSDQPVTQQSGQDLNTGQRLGEKADRLPKIDFRRRIKGTRLG